MSSLHTEIAVIGDSLGGVLAAYSACKQGRQVIMTSEYDWIGGQLTSQAVPPDEHRFIEQCGCSESYRQFRQAVRDEIKARGTLLPEYQNQALNNPGNGWVSRICHEPAVAERLLREMLQPYLENGQLTLLKRTTPIRVVREGRRIRAVVLSEGSELCARFVLDATDTGELLVLADMDYAVGRESIDDTGEADAAILADQRDQQPFTLVFALEHIPGEDFTIERPENYDYWQSVVPPGVKHKLLSEFMPDSQTGGSRALPVFGNQQDPDELDWWRYRRVVHAAAHQPGTYAGDISLINWPQNDYSRFPLINDDERSIEQMLDEARELNLCLLYWLQTEAPNPQSDTGTGYPGLRLSPETMGTDDGMAQAPYVRESRRIIGRQRLTQSDLLARSDEPQVVRYANSVGIASYPMDRHPTCVSGSFSDTRINPFELPLGCFVPQNVDNLLPACKNISMTHLVNASARVQPTEWLIGEVAGNLAAFCIEQGILASECDTSDKQLAALQSVLQGQGIPLHWPDSFYPAAEN